MGAITLPTLVVPAAQAQEMEVPKWVIEEDFSGYSPKHRLLTAR